MTFPNWPIIDASTHVEFFDWTIQTHHEASNFANYLHFKFTSDLDRNILYAPRDQPEQVWTLDCRIMERTFHAPETLVLPTDPSLTFHDLLDMMCDVTGYLDEFQWGAEVSVLTVHNMIYELSFCLLHTNWDMLYCSSNSILFSPNYKLLHTILWCPKDITYPICLGFYDL